MDFVYERVGVGVPHLCVVSVFWFHVLVVPTVHGHFRAVQDGNTVLDWFVQAHRGWSHPYRNQLGILEDEGTSIVWLGYAL